jgi:hypothetical protein
VFAARQTEAVCCGVSNKSAALTSRIKETARNEEITSACIRHEYLRGVRCTVRGRRSRQCRQLFSKNLAAGAPGLATITDSSLVKPWGVSFANGGVPSGFRTRHKYGPALSASGPRGPTGEVANASTLQTAEIATDRDPVPLQTNKRRN